MADDQGLAADLGPVALFDRSIEGVAIDVCDLQRLEFRVRDDTRRAALRAACTLTAGDGAAIAAQGSLGVGQ